VTGTSWAERRGEEKLGHEKKKMERRVFWGSQYHVTKTIVHVGCLSIFLKNRVLKGGDHASTRVTSPRTMPMKRSNEWHKEKVAKDLPGHQLDSIRKRVRGRGGLRRMVSWCSVSALRWEMGGRAPCKGGPAPLRRLGNHRDARLSGTF